MEQPRVLLLSLNLESWFDEMYKPHLDKLTAKARVQRVKTATVAIRSLSDGPAPPRTRFSLQTAPWPETPTAKSTTPYWHTCARAAPPSSWPTFPPSSSPGTCKASLPAPACHGSPGRTIERLLRSITRPCAPPWPLDCPPAYSQKALSVGNVRPGEAWYRSTEGSRIESRVFAPDSAFEPTEAPVAVGKVGEWKARLHWRCQCRG
ncbi:hypothetical protein VTG60DRAFT_4399 [Thermothelomyces hinnuleus]